ncbi:MAG: malate synthase A [Thermoplasmata archaeon]|nr:malate synthase A [Thermoplasmata archaeon]
MKGRDVDGIRLPDGRPVLSPDAVEFIARLVRKFGPRRAELLERRGDFRRALLDGRRPGFLKATTGIRTSSWTVAAAPMDLRDRRVEITGPTDAKMTINALNSGARVFMADFEDAHSPVWTATLEGQRVLFEAVRGTLQYDAPDGRPYRLAPQRAVLMVRPRGWHLLEPHVQIDGEAAPASLVDFGLFFFHNARELVRRGTGPYFYLPKLEHYPEARLWNDILDFAEDAVELPRGTVRATVLIETLPAAFEMEEILYELRTHSAGLNCGRWDYIFSVIKQFRDDPSFVLPERGQLGMEIPFLASYATLLVRTCHRRGAHAIGGMAAYIPIRGDEVANAEALARVRADKVREVALGYDGTWVAHPGLVPVAQAVFDAAMLGPNQLDRPAPELRIGPDELLTVPRGTITVAGVRTNVRAALRYLDAWLRGTGAVAIDHRMEDAATVEISRAQLWQWIRHGARAEGEGPVTPTLVRSLLALERDDLLRESAGDAGRLRGIDRASRIVDELATGPGFAEFFTPRAYEELEENPPGTTGGRR